MKIFNLFKRNFSTVMLVSGMLLILSTSVFAQKTLEPIQKVEIGKNHEFIVNGKPFFPIMSWAQSPGNYAMLRDLGINTYCGAADPVAAKEAGGYAIPGFKPDQEENGFIFAWIFDDEPDMPKGKGAEAVPKQEPEKVSARCLEIKAASPDRLIFMTLTGHFTREQSTYPEEVRKKLYPEYVKNPDVVGFDIYPIYGSGYASHLNWVGSGVAQLKELTKKPAYAWIESNKGSRWMSYEKQPDVLPIHTRNEVWQAIINGATAYGYFTHAWRPDFKEFAPTPEMQAEMKRLNNQVTRLAPAILANPSGRKISMKLGDGLYCQFKSTELEGSIYIFALNSDLGPGADKAKQFDPITPRSGQAIFVVPGLKKGTKIEVIDEQRTIVAGKGKFTDEFAPLAEHIYKFKVKR